MHSIIKVQSIIINFWDPQSVAAMSLLVIFCFLLLKVQLGSSSSSCLLVEDCQTDAAERFLNDELGKTKTAQVPVLEMTSVSTTGNYQCSKFVCVLGVVSSYDELIITWSHNQWLICSYW